MPATHRNTLSPIADTPSPALALAHPTYPGLLPRMSTHICTLPVKSECPECLELFACYLAGTLDLNADRAALLKTPWYLSQAREWSPCTDQAAENLRTLTIEACRAYCHRPREVAPAFKPPVSLDMGIGDFVADEPVVEVRLGQRLGAVARVLLFAAVWGAALLALLVVLLWRHA